MKSLNRSVWILVGALAATGPLRAQVPAGNDTSDGNGNTGTGGEALGGPAALGGGFFNTAVGSQALLFNTSGSSNTAAGADALAYNTTGGNNIDIGNAGLAADSGSIRLGTAGTQKTAFIAGIENTQVTGAAVYVTSSGQLGVLASSERYKTAIAPMGRRSD